MHVSQNKVNHVVLNLDGSASIEYSGLRDRLIQAADSQIAFLAQLSQDFEQETRVSVYVFSDSVECVIWDMDVLRLPSISELYRTGTRTALLASVLKSHRELAEIPQRYGDHAYASFTITDGGENESHRCPEAPANNKSSLIRMMSDHMRSLPDNWRVGILVPDQNGAMMAENYGFPKGNVTTWDATSVHGLAEADSKMKQAAQSFFEDRAHGMSVNSRGMFSMGVDALNKKTVKSSGLAPLADSSYLVTVVDPESAVKWPKIRDWVPGATGHTFRTGMVFQELVKTTEVSATKALLVLEEKSGRAYGGTREEVRSLLGLTDNTTKIKPEANGTYAVFVQSTSSNRKPVVGQRMLLKVG